jgi:hypothetical protein
VLLFGTLVGTFDSSDPSAAVGLARHGGGGVVVVDSSSSSSSSRRHIGTISRAAANKRDSKGISPTKEEKEGADIDPPSCPYASIQDLTDVERDPRATRARHMVDSGGVPLMRCVRSFLCQFGGWPASARNGYIQDPIVDEPQWLPSGPDHRVNEWGVTRFQKGYLERRRPSQPPAVPWRCRTAARSAEGSPWEVPRVGRVGREPLVRDARSDLHGGTAGRVPPQQQLGKPGSLPIVRRDFPRLDWVLSCRVVDEANVDG